jgi:hypothetical protein
MPKKIELTKGYEAIVSDEDYDWLNQWSWCVSVDKNGNYPRPVRKENGKKIYMYRQIMGVLDESEVEVDHKNKNTLDNRRLNLRKCTKGQNQRNGSSHKSSSSKYRGVSFDKALGKFVAKIKVDGKLIHIGVFGKEKSAAKAYNKKAKELHGEYASLNQL